MAGVIGSIVPFVGVMIDGLGAGLMFIIGMLSLVGGVIGGFFGGKD